MLMENKGPGGKDLCLILASGNNHSLIELLSIIHLDLWDKKISMKEAINQ